MSNHRVIISPFTVGQTVMVTSSPEHFQFDIPNNPVGIVRHISTFGVHAIEFPTPYESGHDCAGHTKSGCGQYVPVESLIPMPDPGQKTDTSKPPVSIPSYHSQKASGLMAISGSGPDVLSFCVWSQTKKNKVVTWYRDRIRQDQPLDKLYGDIHNGHKFLRPCPTVPRHGFVDSRKVESLDDVQTICEEITATGEPIEFILMPLATAEYSGILTPTVLSIGTGNDGATSGKAAINIPAHTKTEDFYHYLFPYSAPTTIRKFAKLKPSDTPFIEFVENNGTPYFVQLRSGPAVPSATRVCDAPFTVERIIPCTGTEDLLIWERTINEAKAGSVVHFPNGVLTSHYAVHCLVHNVPISVESNSPVIGERFEGNAITQKLNKHDYIKIAKYAAYTATLPLPTGEREEKKGNKSEAAVMAAVATLHAQGAWGNDDHLLRLRGYGATAFFRYIAATVLGESRHSEKSGPGCIGIKTAFDILPRTLRESIFNNPARESDTRKAIYKAALSMPFGDLIALIKYAEVEFTQCGWPGGYGGKHWEECARVTRRLGDALAAFFRDKTKTRWNYVITAFNHAVNTVHNNGPMLSKFVSTTQLDAASKVPLGFLINSVVADIVLKNRLRIHARPSRVLRPRLYNRYHTLAEIEAYSELARKAWQRAGGELTSGRKCYCDFCAKEEE